jgi:hypothetical protein
VYVAALRRAHYSSEESYRLWKKNYYGTEEEARDPVRAVEPTGGGGGYSYHRALKVSLKPFSLCKRKRVFFLYCVIFKELKVAVSLEKIMRQILGSYNFISEVFEVLYNYGRKVWGTSDTLTM